MGLLSSASHAVHDAMENKYMEVIQGATYLA